MQLIEKDYLKWPEINSGSVVQAECTRVTLESNYPSKESLTSKTKLISDLLMVFNLILGRNLNNFFRYSLFYEKMRKIRQI